MFSKKNLRRALATFLIGGSLFLMPAANAEIYEADGEYIMSKYETPAVAEQRAVKDAERYAIEQAGVYIESYSRMNNFQLLQDEIISIASGVLKHLQKPIINTVVTADGNNIKILAVIKVEISDSDIEKYLRNSIENRQKINSQLEALRQANAAQTQRIKELETQIANIKTVQDEQRIATEFANEDKIFISNQKTEEAQKLNSQGNYQKSLELSNEALELNPQNSMAYYNRGSVKLRTKNYNSAIEDFTKSIEINPNYSVAYNDRGEAYRYLKQYDNAVANYNKAIELSPNYTYPYNNRGIVHDALKNYDAAISDFNKALELNPNYATPYYNRGNVYMHISKYDNAVADYSKAIELDSNFENAYFNRGFVEMIQKNFKQAAEDFTRYIALVPNDYDAYNKRGICYQALGETEKAVADFEKAKQLGYNG